MPLLATKLHFPQVRSNLVARPRLMAILEKGLYGPLMLWAIQIPLDAIIFSIT